MSEYRKAIEKLIRDALGDFPQGFNAGAVAGVPGWAGDMAYMAQEYPRALLTDTPLRPPVEYTGTTDSIARAAGYEIPGTLSGQLGAAVGGLLSPGPGDLAKFAPLLGAIPFWHGSPHKFDAFDLSKMGTGEGAQAYGWGAYGADAQDTARTYATDRSYVGRAMSGTPDGDAPWDAARIAQEAIDTQGENAAAHLAMVLRARKGLKAAGQEQENQKVLDAIALIERGDVQSKANLYRGEYTWPDPAREAATPLTGEDLLQWDKPLKEQPENVKNAFKRRITEPKAIDGMDMGGNARLRDNRQGQADPTQSQPWVLETVSSNGTVRFGLSQKDVDRLIGGQDVSALTGAQVYQRVAAEQGGFPQASKMMNDLGIPGIRYLDGQSRDGGSGTFNYVMFDDKGIKLLERNGKPIGGLLDKKR
jgi:hypothetical protein